MIKSSTAIKDIFAYECLDSRGFPTVSVTITLENGATGTALVPSGASTGEYEAHELRDKDPKRYCGKGVLKAVENIEKIIKPYLLGQDVCDLEKIDRDLIKLDGSENKNKLGANSILGVSLAAAQAGAAGQGLALFQYLGKGAANQLPTPLINIINGGAHAANSLDFQEFMIVPHVSAIFADNIRAATEVFHTLKKNLIKKGYSVGLGDEGGFAPELKTAEEALNLLLDAISDAGYEPKKDFSIALDVAASELFNRERGEYIFKKSSGAALSSQDLIELYASWIDKYPLVSIEDGLDENDWTGWQQMTKKLGHKVQLVGDDLFVTNAQRLKQGIDNQSGNAVLIKLNQIGTVSETLETIKLAHENNYKCIISHRSGETEDTAIADLTVATGAGQIKTGSVSRGERTAKYNRLLWIEKKLGAAAKSFNPFKKA